MDFFKIMHYLTGSDHLLLYNYIRLLLNDILRSRSNSRLTACQPNALACWAIKSVITNGPLNNVLNCTYYK